MAIINGSYSTSFSSTENPISEGGIWINGEATGIDWNNVATTPGHAIGTSSGAGPGYDDSTAILTGSWGAVQSAQASVFMPPGSGASNTEEVELRLHTTVAPHNITGYEILFRAYNPGGYANIVRWNGPEGNFTTLASENSNYHGIKDGDVVSATIDANGLIIGYVNGVEVMRATDTTYTSGNPGIGFDMVGAGSSANSEFGFSNFSASNVGSVDPTAPGISISPTTIQNEYFGIVRVALPLDQATAVANTINAGTQTEFQYINTLLTQVANTTIPAVAVEGSMYGAVGSSGEVTYLTTQFLPPQVSNAIHYGFNPQVYASEALALVFSFGDENHGMGFANEFGPSNTAMPNATAGDAAFAAAVCAAVFSSAATTTTPNAILGWVNNWKAFYSANGIPGNAHPTADQIDLVARAAAWGDAVGIALSNNLGPLETQTVNFLMDAAQMTAEYSVSLVAQTPHHPFQGEVLT